MNRNSIFTDWTDDDHDLHVHVGSVIQYTRHNIIFIHLTHNNSVASGFCQPLSSEPNQTKPSITTDYHSK